MVKGIKAIIKDYETSLEIYTEKQETYINTINFCDKHKFFEEKRIAEIKYTASTQILYNLKSIINDLKDLTNGK